MDNSTQEVLIKKEVLTRLIMAFFSEDFLENTRLIPHDMRPKGDEIPYRCCIHKERAMRQMKNSLAIAVGAAAGDALMLEEADFEWGYDCGKWFYADTATGEVEEWPDVATGKVSRTLAISGRNFNPSWNRIKVIQRGSGDIEIDSSLTVENKKFSIRLR